MRFRRPNAPAAILLAVCVVILCLLAGCTPQQEEGFQIYLTAEDIRPADMPEAPCEVEVAKRPIISSSNIIDYDPHTHTMTLTPDAYALLLELDVPVTGTAFVACVDGEPIYSGAFWVAHSSLLFKGVTIWKPLGAYDSTCITLRSGYPSPVGFQDTDVRDDPRIIESLKRAGKLREVE